MWAWFSGRSCGSRLVVLVSKIINLAAVLGKLTIIQGIFCRYEKAVGPIFCEDFVFLIVNTTIHWLKKLGVCSQVSGSYMGEVMIIMMITNTYWTLIICKTLFETLYTYSHLIAATTLWGCPSLRWGNWGSEIELTQLVYKRMVFGPVSLWLQEWIGIQLVDDNLMHLSSSQATSGDARAWDGGYCQGCCKENSCTLTREDKMKAQRGEVALGGQPKNLDW